jgi:hypothetical protein
MFMAVHGHHHFVRLRTCFLKRITLKSDDTHDYAYHRSTITGGAPMSRFFAACVLICLSLLLAASGCGPRLANEQTIQLTPNSIRTILIDPTSSAQTVKVSVVSSTGPVKAFLYLSKDDEEVDRKLTLQTATEKVLASNEGSTKIELSASIPANEEVSLRLECSSGKPASVKLRISN